MESFPRGSGRRIERGLPRGAGDQEEEEGPNEGKRILGPQGPLHRSTLGPTAGSVFKVSTMHFGQATARAEGVVGEGLRLCLVPKSSSESLS